jgi:hypothetical protein
MPAQQCFRPNDLDRVQDRGKPAIELDEKQPLAVGKFYTATDLALQDDHLLPERGILSRKAALGLERQAKQVQ